MNKKSTVEEIEKRFDNDVERFSNLETGQMTTLDATFNMELIAQSIAKCYPNLVDVLDIGCGAGNYDVKLLEYTDSINITLSDLSLPMLLKAQERIGALNVNGKTEIIKGDFRNLNFDDHKFDVIIATAVLHHLRDDKDWEAAFSNFYKWLKPGGSIWVFDLIQQVKDEVQAIIYQEKYGQYLTSLKDDKYKQHVFEYIEKEDSPRSLVYQLDLFKQVGFEQVDILHKNLCFASFVAFKK